MEFIGGFEHCLAKCHGRQGTRIVAGGTIQRPLHDVVRGAQDSDGAVVLLLDVWACLEDARCVAAGLVIIHMIARLRAHLYTYRILIARRARA